MKNAKNNCPLTGEIVSYIYGELEGKAEFEFETHLADCTACTDEFAAVSESRYSVFEWKKEAFDPLPTPSFDVPYVHGPVPVHSGVGAGIMAWLQSLGAPVAAAAALALVASVWLLIFTLGKKQEQPAAVSNTPQVLQPESNPKVTVPPPVASEIEPRADVAEIKSPMRKSSRAIPASAVQPRRIVRQPAMVAEKTPDKDVNHVPQAQKAPALTAYQENDDQSLRLAELFDEVGG